MENSNLFFADVMRRHELTEEQEMTLQEWFFPGFPNESPNKQRMESVMDMMGAYTKWQSDQAKKTKPQEKVKPMSDEEIECLAKLF